MAHHLSSGNCKRCGKVGIEVAAWQSSSWFYCKDCLFEVIKDGLADDNSSTQISCDNCGDQLDTGSFCSTCIECQNCSSQAVNCEEHSNLVDECEQCSERALFCSDHSKRWCVDCGNEVERALCSGCKNMCEECGGDNESEAVVCRPCFEANEIPAQIPAVVSEDGNVFKIGEMEVNWS